MRDLGDVNMLAAHTFCYTFTMDEKSFSVFELIYRNDSWKRALENRNCFDIPMPIRIDYVDHDEDKLLFARHQECSREMLVWQIQQNRINRWNDPACDGSITGWLRGATVLEDEKKIIYYLTFCSVGEPAPSLIEHLNQIGIQFTVHCLSANGPCGYVYRSPVVGREWAKNLTELTQIYDYIFKDDLVLFNTLSSHQVKVELRSVVNYLIDNFDEVYRQDPIPDLNNQLGMARIWRIDKPVIKHIKVLREIFLTDPEITTLKDIWELILSGLQIIECYRNDHDISERCRIYSTFHHELARWLKEEFEPYTFNQKEK
jgi:hypothetical protein